MPRTYTDKKGKKHSADKFEQKPEHPPKFIAKSKGRVGFDYYETLPENESLVLYLTDVREVITGSEEMKKEFAVPNRSFVSTNKAGYQILKEAGVPQGGNGIKDMDGIEVIMLTPVPACDDRFYFARRCLPEEKDKVFYLFCVDELYLKSQYHQQAMYRELIPQLQRAMPRSHIMQAGNGIIHARKVEPSKEELELAALMPGITKIGRPDPENQGRVGELVMWGAGGVPILPTQKALCLLSGGLDSPVAAYRMMVRGCTVSGVHYLNSTSETAAVMAKNRRLAERLSVIQGNFTLRFVDINELQTAIVANVRNSNRTLTYKWFMLHLSALLDKENKCLVTGDSLGQVASQTLTNISALYPGLRKPVLPPLMGLNKKDIIIEAKKIGTYEASIQQGADCCQYMMVKTHANITIDQWSLYGEIAKVLRSCCPETLPVTVDTFEAGKLVETTTEEFPFKKIVNKLIAIIDPNHSAADFSRRRARAAANAEDDEAIERFRENGSRRAVAESTEAEAADGDETPKAEETNGKPKAEAAPAARGPKSSADLAATYFGDEGAEKKPLNFFDAGAGTKMIPEAKEAMENAPYGNPASMHGSGRAARMAIEKVRSQIAVAMNVPATNILFTAGGTEANNIALHGYRVQRESWSHSSTKGDEDNAKDASKPLVRVIDLVHHETGSIHPNADLKRPAGGKLHLDACQALGKIDFRDLDLSQVDSITVNSHKINGPCGVGALYVRDLNAVNRVLFGGAQEKGIRPGTENVEGIVGFGAAVQAAMEFLTKEKAEKAAGVVPVYRQVENYLTTTLPKLGCAVNRRGETSGYIVHATLPAGLKMENTDVVTALSVKHKVEIGTGSACNTNTENTTTYETLGITPTPKKRSIRFSYDRFVTMTGAERAVKALAKVLGKEAELA